MPAQPIKIFRPGQHTDSAGVARDFTEESLRDLAAAYNPDLYEAPLVIGHPVTDAPAFGWVGSLSYEDGSLYAHPRQVDPWFAGIVNAGRYKHISASFYLPDSPHNPKPGALYLRHVGFLGAVAPAVKGLGAARFQEGEQASDLLIIQFQEMFMPAPIDSDLAKREADLAAREATFQQQQAVFAEQQQQQRHQEMTAFAEKMIREGKVPPRDKGRVEAILGALDGQGSIAFTEAEKTIQEAPVKVFQGFLESLPVQVDFSERSKPESVPSATFFNAPPGYRVDQDALAHHQRILAHASTHNIDYAAAAIVLQQG